MEGCYLIHFSAPVSGAQHYVGYSSDIDARMHKHLAGKGSVLTARAVKRGVVFQISKTFEGHGPLFEKKLKAGGNLKRWCPLCNTEGGACPAE